MVTIFLIGIFIAFGVTLIFMRSPELANGDDSIKTDLRYMSDGDKETPSKEPENDDKFMRCPFCGVSPYGVPCPNPNCRSNRDPDPGYGIKGVGEKSL